MFKNIKKFLDQPIEIEETSDASLSGHFSLYNIPVVGEAFHDLTVKLPRAAWQAVSGTKSTDSDPSHDNDNTLDM